MSATVVAADGASTVRKKYSVFIYSEAEPQAMYIVCCTVSQHACTCDYVCMHGYQLTMFNFD